MDEKEIQKIFYRDGYRLAGQFLEEDLTPENLKKAIAALYKAIDGLLEAFLERAASDGRACQCKKGCAWCCHQAVFGNTHELFFLRDYIDKNVPEKEKAAFLERARQKTLLTANKSHEEQLVIRAACPFLVDGACAVYEARPMACRIYLSSSEKSCRRDHDHPSGKKQFPQLYEFPLLAGRMLNEGFVAYLKQQGKGSVEVPLEQGYASMLSHGQSIESWLA